MNRWNGKTSALSLTFDDGLKCQLDHAIPAMDKYSIPGTFFLPTDAVNYPLDIPRWRAVSQLHEIGSHSVTHRKAAALNPSEALNEAKYSRRYLEQVFNRPITSYCYPYTDAPSHLQQAVGKLYKQARGGRIAREDKYIVPGDGLNLYNVPCYHVNGGTVFSEGDIFRWLSDNLNRRSWLVLMFHGVGPDEKQWDNVPSPLFLNLLDLIRKMSDAGSLWVAPFGAAAEHYRGLK